MGRTASALAIAGCLVVALAAAGPAAAEVEFRNQWPGAGDGFADPVDLAVDVAGDVYVADTGNDRVQVYDTEGRLLREFGSSGTGTGELDSPHGIALGPQGLVYAADTGNDRVGVFDIVGGAGLPWGTPGSAYGQFAGPHGVTTSAAGTVYVTDPGNGRVQRFAAAGGPVGPPAEWGGMIEPRGITLDRAGFAYVVDAGPGEVRKFDRAGNPVDSFDSFGPAGALDDPTGIATDPDGDLYVADTGNDRVLHIDSSGALLDVVGGPGPGEGSFLAPTGVDTDCRGALYVVDQGNDLVQRFAPPGSAPPPCIEQPEPPGLVLELDAARKQKVKRLAATIECPLEDCRVGIGGRVKGRSRARLEGELHELDAGRPQTVGLDYQGRRTVRRLRKSLRKRKVRKRARVEIAAEATDAEGTVVVELLEVKLRR